MSINSTTQTFTKSFSQMANKAFNLTIGIHKTVPSGMITVTFPQNQIQLGNYFIQFSGPISHIFTQIDYFPPDQQAISTGIADSVENIVKVHVGLAGVMILLTGQTTPLMRLLAVLLDFLPFILLNVTYPPHVAQFFNSLSFITLQFIPNPISWFFEDFSTESSFVNPKFAAAGFDGIFLKTIGPILLIFVMICAIHIALNLLRGFLHKLEPQVLVKMKDRVGVKLIYKLLAALNLYIIIAVVVQFSEFSYNSSLTAISLVACFLTTLAYAFFFGYTLAIRNKLVSFADWKKNRPYIAEKIEEQKIFFTGYMAPGDQVPKPILPVIYVFSTIKACSLLFSYEEPLAQTFIQMFVSLIFLMILIFLCRPFARPGTQTIIFIQQSLFIALHITILVYQESFLGESYDDGGSIIVGWIAIIFGIGIIATAVGHTLVSIFRSFYILTEKSQLKQD